MNDTGAGLEAGEASCRGERVDPLVEKILRAIICWHDDGKSSGWIARNLEAGLLFGVEIDRQTIKAIIAHNEALNSKTD